MGRLDPSSDFNSLIQRVAQTMVLLAWHMETNSASLVEEATTVRCILIDYQRIVRRIADPARSARADAQGQRTI